MKYYCCGGRAISEWLFSYIGNSCARSLVPSNAWEGLAAKVGLLASEASEWAQDFSFTASNAGLKVRIAVPNVWICADLLRGGSLYDKTVYGTAGAVGQAPSRFFTFKKVVYCETFPKLIEFIKDHPKTIWGMVLFAHGRKDGDILHHRNEKTTYPPTDIIDALANTKYKLSAMYMMQCYSGRTKETLYFRPPETSNIYQEQVNILHDKFNSLRPGAFQEMLSLYSEAVVRAEYIRKTLEDMGPQRNTSWLEFDNVIFGKNDFVFSFKEDMEARWKELAITVHTYDDVNALGVDTKIIPGLTPLVEWFTSLAP